jgi:hypothetical protein
MPKRLIARLIVASLALGSAGCHPQCNGDDFRGGVGLAEVVGLPIYIAYCASRAHGAAEKGDAEAQYFLGRKYEYAEGVPADHAEAAKWYEKSADRGYGPAQLAVARLYEFGLGVQQDDVQADVWYSVASSAEISGIAERAVTSRENIEKRMTPEQIAEARKRAQDWKPNSPSASSP